MSPLRRPPGKATVVALFAAVVLVGALVHAVAALAPFAADDYLHRAMLHGAYGWPRSAADLYTFIRDEPAEHRALLDAGVIAWWSDPHLKLVMARPLSSLLVAVDAWIFGADVRAAHLHSLAWFVLWAGAAAALYRRMLGTAFGALALLFLLADDAASSPLGWIANRCVLVSAAAATMAIRSYLALWARPHRRRALALLAWICVALAAGEYAVPVLAAIPAHALTARRDGSRRRTLTLAASALVVVAYALARRAWGAGVHGCDIYADSWRDAPRVAALVPALAFRVGADLVAGASVDLPVPWWMVRWPVLSTATMLAGAVSAVVVVRTLDPRRRRIFRWALLWCAAALAPALTSWLTGRLMLAPAMAASVALSLVVQACRQRWKAGPRAWVPGAFAVLVVVVHGPLAALQTLVVEVRKSSIARSDARAASSLLTNAPLGAADRVVVVNGMDAETMFFGRFTRIGEGLEVPAHWNVLASTPTAVRLERVSERAVDVAEAQGVLRGLAAPWFRSGLDTFRVGDHVATEGMDVDVLETAAGRPTRVRFTFARALEDPTYLFTIALPDGLHRVSLPAVGASVTVPFALVLGRSGEAMER